MIIYLIEITIVKQQQKKKKTANRYTIPLLNKYLSIDVTIRVHIV